MFCSHREKRGDPVLHIELRKWADVAIVAPLDANTLAKVELNTLTSGWDGTRLPRGGMEHAHLGVGWNMLT